MKRIGMAMLLAVCIGSNTMAQEVSPGAAALGYTKCVINERPTASDVAPGNNENYKWFSGQWYAQPPSLDHYSTQDGVLVISQGGDLVSAPRDFSTGKLPLLPGSNGFYVEFDVRLSDDDPDHFPAVWLMPAEHNAKQEDQYVGDPAGFERWMELDIDEGGFGPGLTGTVHSWHGIYPNIQGIQNPNNVSSTAINRSQKHTFGGSYDPVKQAVTWWVDGVKQINAGFPHVPAVAARQNFYLIISAQSHGKQKPYSMFVSGVRAYVPPTGNARTLPEEQLVPIELAHVKVGGEIGRRIDITATNNILRLDVDGVFLGSFEKKNDKRNGYVALGKLIDSVVRLAYYTRNENLISLKEHLIGQIIRWQAADGYLGNMIPENRMWEVWDIHELNYIIFGLITDYRLFGEKRSLAAARKAADYILNNWSQIPPDWEKKTTIAAFVSVTGLDRTMLTLYSVTGDYRYLEFEFKQRDLEHWNPGIVIGRRPLVEGHTYAYLAVCLAQLELYRIRPQEKLLGPTLEAMIFITAKDGMTITGGIGQAEIWTADQDGGRDLGETCSTAYQIRVYESLLRLKGDSRYGDLMERTIFNTLFGAQSPDGRKIRYFMPFEGNRVYIEADNVCCPGNYRRIISELPSMVYYRAGIGVAINLYSPSTANIARDDGSSLTVQQETDYPNSGRVLIRIDPSAPASFPLKLRIPSWSKSATISVNGKTFETACVPGTFAVIERLWKAGDQVALDLPIEWRLVQGRQRQAGRAAVMRGPLVFGLDPRQNESLARMDAADVGRIVIDLASIEPNPVPSNAARPNGIGCRLKAGTVPGALGNEGNITLTFTEFADPNNRAIYFRVPDLSTTVADELTGLWETDKGRSSSTVKPRTPL